MNYKIELKGLLSETNYDVNLGIINKLTNEDAKNFYDEISKYYNKKMLALPLIKILEVRKNQTTISFKLELSNFVNSYIYIN